MLRKKVNCFMITSVVWGVLIVEEREGENNAEFWR